MWRAEASRSINNSAMESTMKSECRYSLLIGSVFFVITCMCPILTDAQTNNWLGGAGNWSNGGMWSLGTPPSGSQNANIDNGNANASAVALDTDGQCSNLTIDRDDSLSFNEGQTLTVDGSSITNNGAITVNSSGGSTGLFLSAVDVTLSGKGRVRLTNYPNSFIDGNSGLTLTNRSTIQGSGQIGPHFTFSNVGTLRVGHKLDIDAPFVNFNGNTLTGGTYVITGTLQFTGANVVTNSANITLKGARAAIVDQSNNNALTNLATITNTGSLSLMSGNVLTVFPSVLSIVNAGTLKIGRQSELQISGTDYTQTAGQTIVDGILNEPNPVSFQGGKVFGTGSIIAEDVDCDGPATITAGDSKNKAGQLSMSHYSQGATCSLNIQIGGTTVGTQYSQLAVDGAVLLDGTLNVNLIGGFVPAVGNTFTIITGSAFFGQFSTVNLPILNGAHFVINYNPANVTLTVVSG